MWCKARDSADVKAYKCIQMLALRKAGGVVLGDIFHLAGGGVGRRFFVLALVNKNWTEKIKICTTKTKTQTESERE